MSPRAQLVIINATSARSWNVKRVHLTALPDDVEVFAGAEYFAGDRLQEQWNAVVTDGVMLFPVRIIGCVKNLLAQ